MKLNIDASRQGYEDAIASGGEPAGRGRASGNIGEPKGFRRLKFNELVSAGDFVVDELLGLQPWEGPRGFQAGSFVKPIYRPQKKKVVAPKKGK